MNTHIKIDSSRLLKNEDLKNLFGGTQGACGSGSTLHVCSVYWYYGGNRDAVNACIPDGTTDDCAYVEAHSGVWDCIYCVSN